jgi:indole-3-glycerol phosphate synthase
MTTLDDIIAVKRDEAAALRRFRPPSSFADEAFYARPVTSLSGAIREARRPAVIAEIKKASPSAGVLNGGVRPAELASGYRDAGAAAVSILTDRRFFGGCPEDLTGARGAVEIPLLRKDFIVDEIQVYESRSIGADAILLIAAALDPSRLADLHDLASELGLECLVEVHGPSEPATLDFGAVRIVGINNRDLRDFTIDLGVTATVAPLLPPGVLVVSESGLKSAADVRTVAAAGIDAVLMGEYFMRGDQPALRLRRLLDELREG